MKTLPIEKLTEIEIEVLTTIMDMASSKDLKTITLREIEDYPYENITPDEASVAFQSLVEKGALIINSRLEFQLQNNKGETNGIF